MKSSPSLQNDRHESGQSDLQMDDVLCGEVLAERYQLLKCHSQATESESWLGVDQVSQESVVAVRHKNLNSSTLNHLQTDLHQILCLGSHRIAKILATETTDDSIWCVIEPPPGERLSNILRKQALPFDESLYVFREMLLALEEIHSVNVAHQSLSPDKFFLAAENDTITCSLVWSGNSEIEKSSGRLQNDELEKLFYLSPEVLGLTTEVIGPVSDIYSVGCILYHLLAGHPPVQADNLNDLLYLQTTQPPPTLRELGQCQSRFLDDIVQRCLQFYSRDRYQSVSAILFDVNQLIDSLRDGHQEPKTAIGSKDIRTSLANPAFCGRQKESATFLEAIRRTRQGNAQDILLEGESGVGKSRLLREFTNLALGQETSVYRGIATIDLGSPFQILDNIAQQIAANANENPALAAQIRSRCLDYSDIIVNALPVLKDLFQHQSQEEVPASIGEASTLRAICFLLDSLGSQDSPAVVIFDDCQWDLEFTTRLLKMWKLHRSENLSGFHHTMLLSSFRTEEVSQTHPIRSLAHVSHLQLEPISAIDIRHIVESMSGPLPENALATIQELAAGSPFMASAILHGLVESGGLFATPSGWEIDDEKFDRVHSSAKAGEILTQRLDQLCEKTRHLLEVGAILGSEFDLEIVSAIVELSENDLEDALRDARQRQLLWSRTGKSSCQFLHDKIREELLSRLSATQREESHRRIAYEIQRRYPNRTAELAYHFEAAGVFDHAHEFAITAAHEALQKHALQLAKQQYEIAIRTADHALDADLFAVQEGCGQVLMLLGNYQQAEKIFDEAARSVTTELQRAEIRGKQGELCIKRGDMNSAIKHFENALLIMSQYIPKTNLSLFAELAKESCRQILHTLFPSFFYGRYKKGLPQEEKLTLKLLSGFSHASWYCRSKPLTLWAHLRGMNKGELYHPSIELAQAYSDHAPAMILIPYYSRAYQYVVRSLEIRNELKHVWGQGQSLHFKGIVHYADCDYENCIDECRKAIKILERTGDYWQVHIARYQLAAALFRVGKFEEASEECRRNYESGQALGDHQASGIILDIWVQASLGRLPDGILETELNRDREDVQGESQVILAAAISQLNNQQTGDAIQLLQTAKEKIESAGVQNTYTCPIYTWLVTAYRCLAEEDKSVTQLHRKAALRNAKKAGRTALRITKRSPNELPRLYRELATIAAMEGDQVKAKSDIQCSIVYARKHAAKIELAHTLLTLQQLGSEYQWEFNAEETESFAVAKVQLDLLRLEVNPVENRNSISLADRFETLMQTGRNIMSARDTKEIAHQGVEAARRLLRAPIAKIQWQENNSDVSDSNDTEKTEYPDVDRISVEVIVRSEVTANLVVEHEEQSRSFNMIDHQIAEFISSLIGAALENADGFQELQQLNENLETRVAERTEELKDRNDQLSRSNLELETVAKALRRTQSRLVESIRSAREASEAKGRFLAMMSHEIRTPMNGIIGMTQLALQSCRDPRQKSHLSTVTQSAKTLLTILNDVLDFSKIEAGKLEIEKIQFALHDSVVDACRLLAIKAEEKHLKFRCLISPEVPEQVLGDPNRIRQVLLNLIGNAIKFTASGSITVLVEPNSNNPSDTQIRFSVVDTGIGIPEQDVGKVFNAFDQGDASVTRRFGGTGLGLSISHQLVSLMGGGIQVESELGTGSNFSFVLDLQACSNVPKKDVVSTSVLLCSHDEVAANYLKDSLEALGHRVEQVKSAGDLKRFIPVPESSEFAAIIVDLEDDIPDQDDLLGTAIDLAPVILLVPSARETDPSLELCMNLCTSIMKPFALAELQQAIEKPHSPEEAFTRKIEKYEQPKLTSRSLEILVIDDSEINLLVAQSMIESFGHHVTTAISGAEGIDKFQAGTFNAIFMDIEMPEMDGLTAAQKIREMESSSQRTPIYAMTAHVLDEYKVKCQEVGMNGFISKPIDQQELDDFLSELSVTAR